MMLALLALVPPVICIDPGHPSEVGIGTKGKKLTEVSVAWEISKLLKARLTDDGYTVVMTKSSLNQKVTNKERAGIANSAGASLFLRLHCDAASGSGFTTYYPTKAGTAKGVTGPSKEVLQRTAPVAKAFYGGIAAALKGQHKDNGLRSDTKTFIGGKQGALTGSIFATVPTVLVEMVVLTNPNDETWIASAAGKQAMVNGLAAGVHKAVPIQ